MNESFFELEPSSRLGASSTLRLRFLHDRIQEAAIGLISDDEQRTLQYDMGMALLDHLSHEKLESNLFVVVNLLNHGSTRNAALAKLNCRAAQKSRQISGFASVSTYTAIGISHLSFDGEASMWNNHTEIALELFSLAAESEHCIGNRERMEEYCQTVMSRTRLSVFHKLRCYSVMIDNLGARGRPKEAVNLALDVLDELGCKFPRSGLLQGVQAVLGLQKAKSAELPDLSSLPLMSDPGRIEAMRMIDKANTYAYIAKNPMMFLLGCSRMVKWTIKFGLAEESPAAFASFALVLTHALGDAKAGAQYANLALTMLERLEKKYKESFVILICHGMVSSWKTPLQAGLNHYMDGYRKGMAVGDSEAAMSNMLTNISVSFLSGKPLKTIEEDCRTFAPQMASLKQDESLAWQLMLWQSVLNLMGRSNNTTILTGSAMNEADFLKNLDKSKNIQQLIAFHLYKGYVGIYFGDFEAQAKLALLRGDQYLKDLAGAPLCQIDPFSRGIALYAMARRKNKQRKYRRHGNHTRKILRSWLHKGNPNVSHHLRILDAEHAALQRDYSKASKLYTEAATLSSRAGFLQDAALSHERHSDLLLHFMNDKEEAAYHIKEAIRFYTEWGAMAKVQLLYKQKAKYK